MVISDIEFENLAKKIGLELKNNLNSKWDGKKAILFMKDNGSKHWKQMEWIGFYFEFMCDRILKNVLDDKKVKYGNVTFDGFLKIPWDYKSHSSNISSKCPTNGLVEINKAIKEFGCIGLIIADGFAQLEDDNQSFKNWHDTLKGKKSDYVKKGELMGRSSRKRKEAFQLSKIIFMRVNAETIRNQGTFQKGMINADGSLRNEKLLIDMNKANNDILFELEFD